MYEKPSDCTNLRYKILRQARVRHALPVALVAHQLVELRLQHRVLAVQDLEHARHRLELLRVVDRCAQAGVSVVELDVVQQREVAADEFGGGRDDPAQLGEAHEKRDADEVLVVAEDHVGLFFDPGEDRLPG